MSDPVGARLPRWIGTIAIAAMAATAIGFNPLAAGASETTIAEFPTQTSGSKPQAIVTGADGNLWFTESTAGSRIGRITPKGVITEFTGLTSSPFWITSGPDGNLWVTESSGNAIGVMSTAGSLVGEFTVTTPNSDPDQITAGPDGNLWFTENLANQIGKITPGGVITEFPIPSAGSGPAAIVAGSDGNVWFTEQNINMIGRITTTAGAVTEGAVTEFGPVGGTPAGMALGPDGYVWFTEYGAGAIGRISKDGAFDPARDEFAVTTGGSAPASIAAGPDGNLWFTEYGANKIGRMSPEGVMLAEFATPTAGSAPNGITTGPDGNLWFTESAVSQIGRLTPGTASDATALTYDGATTGDFNDPATVSATLTDASTPLSGQSVVFTLNGAETCTGVTDASGRASCQLTPGETAATYSLTADFAGTPTLKASSISASFVVTIEEAALTLTAPAAIANGSPLVLNAALTTDGAPLAGQTVTFSLGSGDAAQTCSAITSATGAATCTIATVNQPLGSSASGLLAGFVGDGFYTSASAGGSSLVFAFVSGGMFVIGDGSAHVGGAVTFWSSKWANSNTMSGWSGAASFKGFAPTTTPTCGGTWTSTTGNSSNPPAGPLPAYMAVVVTSSLDKSGSTVTGKITQIVIVKTDLGYSPDPGGTGTGTVVGVLCSA